MKGAFTPEFTPVARPGQICKIDAGSDTDIVEIDRMAPLPAITTDEITVKANSESDKIEVDALETDDGFFAQYRPVNLTQDLPDGVSFRLFQSAESNRSYTNRSETAQIDNETVYELLDTGSVTELTDLTHLLELFVWEDDDLYLQFTNTTDSEESFSLTYAGFNFDASPVQNTREQPIYVPATAIRGGVNTS